MKISIKSSKTGREVTSNFSCRDLLALDEETIIERMTVCNCEPIGETNVIECDCYEEWDDYQLSFEDDNV